MKNPDFRFSIRPNNLLDFAQDIVWPCHCWSRIWLFQQPLFINILETYSKELCRGH